MRSSWYKDPLVAFFAVGFVMFVIAGGIGDDEQSNIEIRTQDIDRLAQQWSLQMRREPQHSRVGRAGGSIPQRGNLLPRGSALRPR